MAMKKTTTKNNNIYNKKTKNLVLLEIFMFTVLIIYSSMNMYFDYSALIAIIKEGNDVIFDSFNFMYQVLLFPINTIMMTISIIIMILILKKTITRKNYMFLPNALIFFNFIINVIFHPGLNDIKNFNIFFVKDYAILLIVFIYSMYSVFYQLIKRQIQLNTTA